MGRAVLVDMWGTIIEPARPRRDFRVARVRGLLLASGVEPTSEVLERAVAEYERHWDALWVERTTRLVEIPAEEDIRAFLRTIGVDSEVTEAHLRAYSAPYLEFTRIRKGVKRALRGLSGRYGLAVVSNVTYGPMVVEKLGMHGLLDYFDEVVTSYDVGLRKPHPEIFARALDSLGADPSEAVMIGDELVDDVIGARSAGVRAILLGPPGSDHGAADAVVREFGEVPRAVQSVLG